MKNILMILIFSTFTLMVNAQIFEVPASDRGAVQTFLDLAKKAGRTEYTIEDAIADAEATGLYRKFETNESSCLLKGWALRWYEGDYTLVCGEKITILDGVQDLSFIKYFNHDGVSFEKMKTKIVEIASTPDVAWAPEDQIEFLFSYLETEATSEISQKQTNTLAFLQEKDESFKKMTLYFLKEIKNEKDTCLFIKGCHALSYTRQAMVERFYYQDKTLYETKHINTIDYSSGIEQPMPIGKSDERLCNTFPEQNEIDDISFIFREYMHQIKNSSNVAIAKNGDDFYYNYSHDENGNRYLITYNQNTNQLYVAGNIQGEQFIYEFAPGKEPQNLNPAHLKYLVSKIIDI
jgi:hypothetical protein